MLMAIRLASSRLNKPAAVKTTQIGGSPPKAVARLTLYDELGEERLGNPMFICPGWQDFDV